MPRLAAIFPQRERLRLYQFGSVTMADGQQGDDRQAAIPGFDERILQLWTRIVRRRIRFRRLTLIWAHLGQYISQCRRRGRE